MRAPMFKLGRHYVKQELYHRKSRRRVRQIAASVVICGGLLGPLAHAQSKQTTIYKETYRYCTGSLGREAALEGVWGGYKSGSPLGKFSNLKVFSYGSLKVGGSVNSNPQGFSEGYAFWFRPVYGLSIVTAEMNFDVKYISTPGSLVSYDQRLSGIDVAGVPNRTQLAFLIDQTWYISREAARQVIPGAWEPVQVDPSTLLYGTVPYVSGLGAEVPTSYGTSLPSGGTVRAFGIFMTEVNGRVRLDNFEIKTSAPVAPSISTAIQASGLSGCPATSPDVTGGGVPPTPPPPDPDDSDGTIDQFLPTDPVPPGVSIVSPIAPQFCPIAEQGVGVKVKISKSGRKAFLRKAKKTTPMALRDEAIAQIVSSRIMPLGALVNVRVGDYDTTTGGLKVVLRRNAQPKTVRLSKTVRGALDSYLASLGSGRKSTDPLLVTANRTILDGTKAVCSKELKSVVTKRARVARLSTKSIFVK